jgi:hypothetical protein
LMRALILFWLAAALPMRGLGADFPRERVQREYAERRAIK